MTIADAAHEDANIIFGSVIDESFGDEVKITVIATGFEGPRITPRRAISSSKRHESELPRVMSSRPPVRAENLDTPTHIRQRWAEEGSQGPRVYQSTQAPQSIPPPTEYDTQTLETLDIPTFLRRQAD